MNPVETYLDRIRRRLPRKNRDDIVQELRVALLERIDRQEAEWGRTLTDSEQTTIVRGFGNPFAVAARYWTGSGLFGGPFAIYYRATMAWAGVAILIVHTALLLWRAQQGMPIAHAVGATVPGMVWAALTATVVITLVFMALDGGRGRLTRNGPA